MNPTFERYFDYIKYRNLIKAKMKNLEYLDGVQMNDNNPLGAYKPKPTDVNLGSGNGKNKNKLYTIAEEGENGNFYDNKTMGNNKFNNQYNDDNEGFDENELNNIIVMKKRHSSITFSQRMLRKADNLTKFNRKNHSEGNKHITNDYL